jgi:hypothetical protein
MTKINEITKEELEILLKKHNSVRKILKEIGENENCGWAYKRFYKLLETYQIDLSNWGTSKERQNWCKGLTKQTGKIKWGYTKEEIFCEKSSVSTRVVRNYLENESDFQHKCQNCGITDWLGQKVCLDLDHINGNNRDNRRENLRFMCLNCHGQTHTFRGKNIDRKSLPSVSDEQLLKALRESPSIRKALLIVGLTAKGGNYTRVYRLINQYNIKHLKKST